VTIKTTIQCNREGCGNEVQPPQNAGWAVVMVTAPDGQNVSGVLGHFCLECTADLRGWAAQPKRLIA
jgi:hypothetical protein